MGNNQQAGKARHITTVFTNGAHLISTASSIKYVFDQGLRHIQKFFINEDQRQLLDVVRHLQSELHSKADALAASSGSVIGKTPTAESIREAALVLVAHAQKHGFVLQVNLGCHKTNNEPQVRVAPAAKEL